MKNISITKTVVVKDKKERIGLSPRVGTMAVQKDEHERHYFDGIVWRLYRPGTAKHWRNTGKPNPEILMPKTAKAPEMPEETTEKKTNNTAVYTVLLAVAAMIILLAAYFLIN